MNETIIVELFHNGRFHKLVLNDMESFFTLEVFEMIGSEQVLRERRSWPPGTNFFTSVLGSLRNILATLDQRDFKNSN